MPLSKCLGWMDGHMGREEWRKKGVGRERLHVTSDRTWKGRTMII